MFAAISPALIIGGLIGLALGIWALVDSIQRPDWVWQSTGQNKTLWIALNVVGLLICGLLPLGYLIFIRPKLVAAQKGGSGGYPG